MYQVKEIRLTNGGRERKRLVIEFCDPDKQIVGEFLMSDAPMLNGIILQEIDQVLNGKKRMITSSGNRCFITVKSDVTMIEDLLTAMEGVEAYPPYTLDTKELRELIVMWFEKIKLDDH